MQITKVQIAECGIPLPYVLRLGPVEIRTRDYVLLRVETDAGVFGEAIGYPRGTPLFDTLSSMARRILGKVPNYFRVEKFDVNVEQRDNAVGERVTVSLAVVKVKVDDETLISAAEGNGPVNALDLALRKDLGKYQVYINGLELTDYRVRILNTGTEAVTRVLIESQDETGERWTTVGVSPNIIDASFQALMDSIVYKLVRSGAPA